MSYTALISDEKERLEKVNQGINEIQGRISELEAKVVPVHEREKTNDQSFNI